MYQWLLFIVVAGMVLYPVSWLVRGSFWSSRPGADGFFTLRNYVDTFSDPYTWQLLGVSFAISAAQTLLACALGVFLAWLVARTDVPFVNVVESLAPVPFFVPGLLVAMGWAILANPTNGSLNTLLAGVLHTPRGPINIYTAGGIIWVEALHSAAFVYLLVVGAMRNMDTTLEESARMSGASGPGTFRHITLPLLIPALSGAAILTFIAGLEAFETPAILGTPGKVFVFTNEIYYNLRWVTPANYGAAMTLAILLTLVMLVVVLLQWLLLRGRTYTTITGRGYRPQRIHLGKWAVPALALFGLYLMFAVVLPIGLVIATSFFSVFGVYTPQTLTLNNYLAIVSDPQIGRALSNTLFLAVGGAFLAMLLSSVVAYVVVRTDFVARRVLELIVWLPWALPGIVLSLAMLWAYIRLPVPIYGTIWVLLLAYVTFGLPLGVRTMSGVLTQVSRDLEESARTSGASWRQTFVLIVLALVRPGFIAGWLLLGVLFMRSLSVALTLYANGSEVLSMVSFVAWELGQGTKAAALATAMLLLIIGFVVLDMAVRAWERRRLEQSSAFRVETAAAQSEWVAR